jgi:hypothetical protein
MAEKLLKKVGKGHLSYSSIKHALVDMRQWERYMKGEIKYKSDALDFGNMYDMLLFERDKAMKKYTVLADGHIISDIKEKNPKVKSPKATTEYKTWLSQEQQLIAESGGILTSSEDWGQANGMIDRLDDCGLLQKRLTGKYQVEFNATIDGVPLRGFLDCLGDGFITDSKSTRGIKQFRYDADGLCYDVQAYIYTKVFGIDDYYWVAQEKTYPYLPAEIKCSEKTLFRGEMKYTQAIENINQWLDGDTPATHHYLSFEI